MKTNLLILSLFPLLLLSCSKDNRDSNEVYMENLSFKPSSLTISAGTTVTWTNKESVTHTVTSNSGIFDSNDIGSGGTYSRTFNSTGTFPYHCKHHSGMTGTIIVQQSSSY